MNMLQAKVIPNPADNTSMNEMQINKITDFEVIDHGISNHQYYQGCGTAFTEYSHCATGAGESAFEAFNDALEQICNMGDCDPSVILQSDDGKLFSSEKAKQASVEAYLKKDGIELKEDENCELYYYVSIRWN